MSDENEKIQKRNIRKRSQIRSDYRATFGSDCGQRVLADLFRTCILDNVGFMQSETALHSQGRRWVYARIHKMLNMNDEELLRLTRENQ